MRPRRLLALIHLLPLIAAWPAVAPSAGRAAAPYPAPPAPALIAVSSLGGQSRAIGVEGSTAYFVESATLVVADVSDPDRPRRLSSAPLLAPARGIFVAQGLIYLALGSHGLLIIDVHDPLPAAQRLFLPQLPQ